MTKTWRLIALLPAIMSAACLKVDLNMALSRTGSATVEARYSVSEQTISTIKAARKIREQLAAISGEPEAAETDIELWRVFLEPVEADLTAKFKEYEKFGVTAETVRVESRQGWRTVRIKLNVNDMAQLARIDDFRQCGLSLTRDAEGNYTLAQSPIGAQQEPTSFSGATALTQVGPMLAGFNVRIAVTTPGTILRTNAHQKGLSSAVWSFDFDADPNSFSALQRQQFRLVFDGAGLNLPVFSLAPAPAASPGPKK